MLSEKVYFEQTWDYHMKEIVIVVYFVLFNKEDQQNHCIVLIRGKNFLKENLWFILVNHND